jgi:preprotein translocase subunit SecG
MPLLDSTSLSSLKAVLAIGANFFQNALHGFFQGIFGTSSQQVCNVTKSCENLFSYATSAVAFLFIIALILIFVFMYDNMRRGRRTAVTT